ncbi:hypothetical protein CASFOL_019614 [Castilleja foliolosa]|uniref:J domain-containing protein n=1 Tax=Castilleja foliolosa TaxID=1961234 RepID=A0ABD3D8T4_9LAMI
MGFASPSRSSKGKWNGYNKRQRKQCLLRDVNGFTEHLFQTDTDEYDPSAGRESSRLRREDGSKKRKSKNRASKINFEFCGDEDDNAEFETIFRYAFGGGTRCFHWSFTMDDEPRFRNSSKGSKYRYDKEYDLKPFKNMCSDRLALGLRASGPLNIDDVKNAYRACALKWHPDRHEGSSKAVAEEKFKVCNAAYQSLCDKLAVQ